MMRRETFVPQSCVWAQEALVDWYEAWVDFGDERTRAQVFVMRSMASGAAFHRAYLHATQQAFLEAHEHAFAYFGGVCVTVKTNFYPVPAHAGTRVGKCAYIPCMSRSGMPVVRLPATNVAVASMFSISSILSMCCHKPGALAGSKPLAQWREAGRWPASYDELWDRLRTRHGKQNGTRAMVAVLALGRDCRRTRRVRQPPDWSSGLAVKCRRRQRV